MSGFDHKALEEKLSELSARHQTMDIAIKQFEDAAISIDHVKISRLKKEKLLLKEQIESIKKALSKGKA